MTQDNTLIFCVALPCAWGRGTHKSVRRFSQCTLLAGPWGRSLGLLRHWSHALTAGRAGRKVIQQIAEMLPLPWFSMSLPLRWGLACASLGELVETSSIEIDCRGARVQEAWRRNDYPPALLFAASLGALARLGMRAKARHFF